MKNTLFLLLTIILFSCNSNDKDVEKAKTIAEQWTKENVLQLYNEKDHATLLSTKEDIEKQAESKYIANKYKWKGIFDNDFNFSENSELGLLLLKMYDDYTKYSTITDITDEKIAYKSYLYEWTNRASNILQSADCEMKIKDSNYFYVIRFYIKHKDNNPELTKEEYLYDRVDVILDDKFNVINNLDV